MGIREKIILDGNEMWLDKTNYPLLALYPTETATHGILADVLFDGKSIGSNVLNDIEKRNLLEYLHSNTVLEYPYAFEKYIKNQKVVGMYSDKPLNCYSYVEGIKFENGYVFASRGGGCSGEDCNTTMIISPNNIIIANFDW